MKFLIIGMGPGEISQGKAFGQYVKSKNHQVDFIVLLEENLELVQGFFENVDIQNDGIKLKKIISNEKYDVVILCSSKLKHGDQVFQNQPPKNKPLVVSLDSNWLFGDPHHWPCVAWIDKIFINMPPPVFKNGLQDSGGAFVIPSNFLNKITTVGLIPSFKPIKEEERKKIRKGLEINEGEKLIFSYFGRGGTFGWLCLKRYLKVFDLIYEKYREKIKIIFVGGLKDPEYNHIFQALNFKHYITNFFEILASSDLVVQHHGLGTLEQAISANIPAVATVPNMKIVPHQYGELRPFEKEGLCKIHFHDDPAENISKTIEGLLFSEEKEKMINTQKKFYSCGEAVMLENILNTLNCAIN